MYIYFETQVKIPYAKKITAGLGLSPFENKGATAKKMLKKRELEPIFANYMTDLSKSLENIKKQSNALRKLVNFAIIYQQIDEISEIDVHRICEGLGSKKIQQEAKDEIFKLDQQIFEESFSSIFPGLSSTTNSTQNKKELLFPYIDDNSKFCSLPNDVREAKKLLADAPVPCCIKLKVWYSYFLKLTNLRKSLDLYRVLDFNIKQIEPKKKTAAIYFLNELIENPDCPFEILEEAKKIVNLEENTENEFAIRCAQLHRSIKNWRKNLYQDLNWISSVAHELVKGSELPDEIIYYLETVSQKNYKKLINFADPYCAYRAIKRAQGILDTNKVIELTKFLKKVLSRNKKLSIEKIVEIWCSIIPRTHLTLSKNPKFGSLKKLEFLLDIQRIYASSLQSYYLFCTEYLANILDPDGKRRIGMSNKFTLSQKCLHFGKIEMSLSLSTRHMSSDVKSTRLSYYLNQQTALIRANQVTSTAQSMQTIEDTISSLTSGNVQEEVLDEIAWNFHLMEVFLFIQWVEYNYGSKNNIGTCDLNLFANKFAVFIENLNQFHKAEQKANILGYWLIIIKKILSLGGINCSFLFYEKILPYLKDDSLKELILKEKKFKRSIQFLESYFDISNNKLEFKNTNLFYDYFNKHAKTPLVPFIFDKVEDIKTLENENKLDALRYSRLGLQAGLKIWLDIHIEEIHTPVCSREVEEGTPIEMINKPPIIRPTSISREFEIKDLSNLGLAYYIATDKRFDLQNKN